MLNLLAKDFKLIFARKENKKRQIFSSIFMLLVIVALITIETFIFQVIIGKIKTYYQAPIAFLTLFLFIISILMMIFSIIQARKLFFNKMDMEQLNVHPVSNGQIIASKLIFLFAMHYITTLMFTYPLFISYGLTFYKPTFFYYIALFYPVLSFIFEVGVALILVYPIKLLADWLKKHLVIQFSASMILMLTLTFLYSKVLTVFIQLVASNNLTAIFTPDFIDKLLSMRKFFLPTRFLVELFIDGSARTMFPFILMALGVFSLGLTTSIMSFRYFKNSVNSVSKLKKEYKLKLINPTKALVKKEFILLFKDSGYILSFTGLLVIQPFLAYMVISALNTIFTSGTFAYYLSMLPNFIPLIDVLLIMLFTLIISQGANSYIAMENQNVRLMKILPISAHKQLFIKVIIPFTLSFVSLFITTIALFIGKVITLNTFIFALVLTTILLAIFDLVSLFEELKVKRNKSRSTFVSSMYSYLLPLLYFVVTVVMSFFGVSIYIVYLLGFIVVLLGCIPYVIKLKKRLANLFLELEMVN